MLEFILGTIAYLEPKPIGNRDWSGGAMLTVLIIGIIIMLYLIFNSHPVVVK